MDKTDLIVVRCYKEHGGRMVSCGERLVDASFSKLEDARSIGEGLRVPGKCVIVRPNYNEEDSNGCFFREWRSFNGEPLKEFRWNIG